MNLPKLKGGKKKERHYTNDGILESGEGIAKALISSVTENVNAGTHDAWNQFLNADGSKQESHGGGHAGNNAHGETVLEEGQEFDLSGVSEKAHELTEAGHEFMREITHVGERSEARHSQQIEVRMHEIMIEIKKLTESSGDLQRQVEVITMEQTGENVGIYHLNFLDKMLTFIHELRMNVDDSLAWFSAINGKKQARSYHSMAKKHGTSFTLNNERQVATQVG